MILVISCRESLRLCLGGKFAGKFAIVRAGASFVGKFVFVGWGKFCREVCILWAVERLVRNLYLRAGEIFVGKSVFEGWGKFSGEFVFVGWGTFCRKVFI